MEVLEQKAFLKKITRRHSPAVIIKGISSTSLTIFIFFKNLLRCKWTAVISFLMLYFSCFCFYLCFYLFIYLFIYLFPWYRWILVSCFTIFKIRTRYYYYIRIGIGVITETVYSKNVLVYVMSDHIINGDTIDSKTVKLNFTNALIISTQV